MRTVPSRMGRREFLRLAALGAAGGVAATFETARGAEPGARKSLPNIVFILADDLGYGDVRCFNAEGKIPTPCLDQLAGEGVRFTDAHSASAVCTPTRYGVLTGRYCWRSRLQRGVLGGFSPRLIEPGRLTVAALLKRHGYHTACIGKWHLGMDWPLKAGGAASDYKDGWQVDYAQPIPNGPTALGFDAFLGISASLDMPPFVFIENDRCQGVPTVEKQWVRKGPAHKDFEAVDVLPALTRRAVASIEERAKSGKPFFLYLPLTSPHTPIVPTPEWRGKSGIHPYADFVMQTDAAIGEVLKALDRAGVAGNTLVIATSDNGFAPYVGVKEIEAKGHYPSGGFRGYKADVWEGGHHIPFIARWPGKAPAGTACDDRICLNSLLATCAGIAGAELPRDAGEDSFSILPLLRGERPATPTHDAIVAHSINGLFALFHGPWKLIPGQGSGGWSKGGVGKDEPPGQLYHLAADPSEKRNLYREKPDVVAELSALLERIRKEGRSRA